MGINNHISAKALFVSIVVVVITVSCRTTTVTTQNTANTPNTDNYALAFPSPSIKYVNTLTPAPVPESYNEWASQQIDWMIWVTESTSWMFSDLKDEVDLDRKRYSERFGVFLTSRIGVTSSVKQNLAVDDFAKTDESMRFTRKLIEINDFLLETMNSIEYSVNQGELAGVITGIKTISLIENSLRTIRGELIGVTRDP